MSILKTFLAGDIPIQKVKIERLKNLKEHTSKASVVLNFTTTLLTMTNMKLMMTMMVNMKNMKLGMFLENQFAERNCGTTLSIWKVKKLQ